MAGNAIEWILFSTARFNESEELRDRVHTRVIAHNKNHKLFAVRDVVFNIENVTDVKSTDQELVNDYKLYQNYPNPFNPATKIQYSIPVAALSEAEVPKVRIVIYDIVGREIGTLVNEEQIPGNYEVEFSIHSDNGRNLSSGIYYYQLTVNNFTETKKMLLIK